MSQELKERNEQLYADYKNGMGWLQLVIKYQRNEKTLRAICQRYATKEANDKEAK